MKDFANTLSDLVSLIFSGKLSFLDTIGAILVLIAAGVFLHYFLKIITLDPNTKITFGQFFKRKVPLNQEIKKNTDVSGEDVLDKNRNISGKKLGVYVAVLGIAIPAVSYPLASVRHLTSLQLYQHTSRAVLRAYAEFPLPMYLHFQEIAGIPFSYILSVGILIFFIGIALIIRNFNPAPIKEHARLEGSIHGDLRRSKKMIQLEELAVDFNKNLKRKYELEMLGAVEDGDVERYSEIKGASRICVGSCH